ncbi:MAG: flagellar biosynthetic protein FliP, partial [Spirochaetae bacterium HGW-Spirochaetae-10]
MKRRVVLFLVSLAALLIADPLLAQEIPGLPIPVLDNVRAARSGQEASTSLALIMLVTVLSLAPALVMMMTSFTKVVIVFDFVRRALALQNMPPNQVLFGLALFLTFFIMAPTFREFNQTALTPYISGDKMSTPTFIEK